LIAGVNHLGARVGKGEVKEAYGLTKQKGESDIEFKKRVTRKRDKLAIEEYKRKEDWVNKVKNDPKMPWNNKNRAWYKAAGWNMLEAIDWSGRMLQWNVGQAMWFYDITEVRPWGYYQYNMQSP
jgi:hypothetical protein